jgi:hypothetical protein
VFSLGSGPKQPINRPHQTPLLATRCFLWGPVTGFIKESIGIIIVIGVSGDGSQLVVMELSLEFSVVELLL